MANRGNCEMDPFPKGTKQTGTGGGPRDVFTANKHSEPSPTKPDGGWEIDFSGGGGKGSKSTSGDKGY